MPASVFRGPLSLWGCHFFNSEKTLANKLQDNKYFPFQVQQPKGESGGWAGGRALPIWHHLSLPGPASFCPTVVFGRGGATQERLPSFRKSECPSHSVLEWREGGGAGLTLGSWDCWGGGLAHKHTFQCLGGGRP